MDRITQLANAGMNFSDPPGSEVVSRINALSDADFAALLQITLQLSVPTTGPTLGYTAGGFQFRAFEK